MSEVVAEQPFQVKGGAYLKDLQKLVSKLEDDLRERSQELPEVHVDLTTRYNQARSTERTLETFESWRDEYLTQVAVGWVLTSVFLRYLEDNNLIDTLWLSGPGERIKRARDQRTHYFQQHPTHTDREYMQEAFRSVAQLPGCEALFGQERNPLWLLGPSGDLAKELITFWQAINPETGELLRVFGDPHAEIIADTRFLGDLYQNLSEAARSRFALLQTPDFVEEFILDRTLEPAIETFGLEGIRMLDPTCGSGHFLLGGFARILEHRHRAFPGEIERVRVQKALDGVYGVDLNPFAVAIARFRLLVAALNASGVRRLKDAPNYQMHVAAGDSLLHGRRFGRGGQGLLGVDKDWLPDAFATGDFEEATRILSQQYHAVVGNPPYIRNKDKAHNLQVRTRYSTCYKEFSLAVPFKELFFDKAIAGERAGFMGMITANSFMKREFGRKLIEEFLPSIDLTHVIDTSGAYIPGHGTPTVILLGRNRRPILPLVRAILGIRGEPGTPADPRKGKVWHSIVTHLDEVGAENEFVTVADVDRGKLAGHPWALSGGGASELRGMIESAAYATLEENGCDIGFGVISGDDNCFVLPEAAMKRQRVQHYLRIVTGDQIRDWCIGGIDAIIWPNDSSGKRLEYSEVADVAIFLWPYRTNLRSRKAFGSPIEDRGIPWYAVREVYEKRLQTPLTITFAEVATHNHFVLDRGGKAFNRSAPVIKLPKGSTEEEYLVLTALLNSSLGCFWLKDVCGHKGSGSDKGNRQPEPAKFRYAFTSTLIKDFPIPKLSQADRRHLGDLARSLIDLADRRRRLIYDFTTPGALDLCTSDLRQSDDELLGRLVAQQEELDWLVYSLYGLIKANVVADIEPIVTSGSLIGARPFEIRMARRGVSKGLDEQPLFNAIPEGASSRLREVWEQRLVLLEENSSLQLIENPNCKRRWFVTPKELAGRVETFEDRIASSLQTRLLDSLEETLSSNSEVTTTSRLAEHLAKDEYFIRVAALYVGRDDYDLPSLVTELTLKDDVPYLASFRYTASGLRKRDQWERTWELQRGEDSGLDVGPIPVPPQYGKGDFLKPHHWTLRGKLDVPKERFISYPLAERDADPSPVIGWAGWNHLQQAKALATYYLDRKEQDGWETDRLTPLLAGLLELVPWLKQWHNEIDPDTDQRLGDFYESFLDDEARSLGLTMQDLRDWRPPAQTKGRKKK